MLKNKRTIIILFLILLFITSFRLAWYQLLTVLDVAEQPSVSEGVLDLRGWELSSYKTFRLDGEWTLYPDELFVDGTADEKQYMLVPQDWRGNFPTEEQREKSFIYGTYRLQILLDDNEQEFGIRINQIENAAAVYANGKLITKIGNPSTNLAEYIPKHLPSTVVLPVENGQIDLIIQVANHTETGGIVKTIRFGTMDAIDKRVLLSIGLQLLVIVVFLIHGMYTLILYFMGKQFKGLLYYSLVMIFGVVTVVTVDDKLLFVLFDISYQWSVKITMLAYVIAISLSVPLNNYLFPNYLPEKIDKIFRKFFYIVIVLILFLPAQWVLAVIGSLSIMMVATTAISSYIFWKAFRDKQDVFYLFVGILILGVNIIWSIMLSVFTTEFIHYPFDLIFSMFAFSAFWFRGFFRAKEEAENLALKLQAEDKQKDTFLINTSHELRNPLHGIINLTQTMLEDKKEPLPVEQKNRLELQLYISRHLSLLIEDLLDITRLKENTIQLHPQTISLSSVVTGVVDMMRLSIEEKEISLKVTIDDALPPLWGDEKRLVQILFNLMHNAVKFTEKGTITVSGQAVGRWVRISVEDTGIGIAEEDMKIIFESYEQGKSRSSNIVEGLGLGLNICRKLVELHGGMIHAQSVVGEGSIFSFTFPIAEEKKLNQLEENFTQLPIEIEGIANHSKDEVAADQVDQRETISNILIVDDNYMNLHVIRNVLETENYYVTTATDAEKALIILQNVPIDLVISDVMMPNISGYEFTRRIREQYSLVELPVLLVTARTRSEDILTGFTVGANDYLTKPVDALELKARVRALTDLKIALKEHVRMEGAWLQSQIQPHFIFNVLNTIASLGISDVQKMQALLEEFSNYLRLSFDFNNADPVVSLEHELSLVRSYIYIEQQRFGERLQVEWAIDSATSNLFIPPLSIQPLVENAMKHGLLSRLSGGTVRIEVNKKDTHYEIVVADNGIGMTEERVATLFERQEGTSTRVGLKNINKRLKQLYNEHLVVESEQNVGTTVYFKIPIRLAKKR